MTPQPLPTTQHMRLFPPASPGNPVAQNGDGGRLTAGLASGHNWEAEAGGSGVFTRACQRALVREPARFHAHHRHSPAVEQLALPA